jgi:TolB-like protein/DNA-binding winged helix-turn-helix (wHTH) protein/Tfp pilus assembly protein PilF
MAGNGSVEGRVGGRIFAGQFEVDIGAAELYRSGRRIALQDKPFRVLSILLQRPGELVTREDLQSQLWSVDTHVEFDEGLNTAIRKLRTAFGDSADNPRFIETVPRRGYRFIAPVSKAEMAAAAPEVPANLSPPVPPSSHTHLGSRRSRAWAAALGALLLLALVLAVISGVRRGAWGFFSRRSDAIGAPRIRSLAVLPLENLSNDPAQDYFADGMTDQLITDLGQIKSLRVISRTSVMQYKGVRKPIAQVARELNVDAVVEGTTLKSGSQVRITAQLIQAPLDNHLWAQSYEGDLHDVISLQNKVARAIAEEIQVTLTPGERVLLRAGRPVNPQAYEDYLQGRYFWNKRDGDALERASEYFQKAISIDPNYAPAYAGLAQTYALFAGNTGPKDEFVAAGKKAAHQALLLDPNLAEAHTALALLLSGGYNFTDEEREFKLAVNLDPNYATGHHWYGEVYLVQMGRFEEANREMRQALALDPASRIIATDWGTVLFWERRYDEAYRQLSKVIAMDAEFSEAYLWRGRVLLQQGKYPAAIADLETAHRINHASQIISPTLAYAYGVSGNRAKANLQLQRILAESRQRYVSPWAIGLVYLGLGDKPRCLDWFEKAVRVHSPEMTAVWVAPEADPLRREPRFKELLSAMKLPG